MDNDNFTCKWYLLEDDPDDVELLQEAIHESNLPVQLVNYFDAERLENDLDNKELPNVIILDINLPTANGIEILAGVKSKDRTRHIPVVMFTSSDLPRFEEETRNIGAFSYITKPSQYDKYNEVVKEIYKLCMKLVE